MSRDPPQRRRARARNGVAPYIPAAFCRDARSAGHGATEAARPERSLQACGFHASDRSDSPKPRQRVRRRLAGAPAAACRSRESEQQIKEQQHQEQFHNIRKKHS
ncbi:hypothetical protein [Escherichia coli]|uniref:hypothetical protein n=1 Tax=Escherichia coli TaxID=562 RepID=UPI0015971792|nr:hypothetical protein [Escherichia coli]